MNEITEELMDIVSGVEAQKDHWTPGRAPHPTSPTRGEEPFFPAASPERASRSPLPLWEGVGGGGRAQTPPFQ